MSFERTKGSIMNLSAGQVFTDDLLDMLVCVVRDVYEVSNVTKADQSALLKKMYNLIKMIQSIYQGNKEGISQFSERIQNEYKMAMDLLATQNNIVGQIVKTTEQEEQTLTELQKVAQDVEARRGHLLSVKEDCAKLQKQIDQLNDPELDRLAEQKAALEKDLNQRQQREADLRKEIDRLLQDINEVNRQIEELEKEVEKVKKQLAERKAEEAKLTKQKAEMEADIVETRAKLESMEKGIQELPALRDKINDAYQEIQVQMTAMTNAVNSAKSDAFLETNLYAADAGGALTVDNYPDLAVAGKQVKSWEELEGWFAELEARINGLMKVYCETLGAVVKKAETITVKKDQE